MATDVLRDGDHRCALGYPVEGQIVICRDCGRIWRGLDPPNPNFAGWRPVARWWARLRGWL